MISLRKLLKKIESFEVIPDSTKDRIKLQLEESYAVFGRKQYVENFLSLQKEAFNRYRHYDVVAWTIITLFFTISFALVGSIIYNIKDIEPEIIYILCSFSFSISILGYINFVRMHEYERKTRKYLYTIEMIFGSYYLYDISPYWKEELEKDKKKEINLRKRFDKIEKDLKERFDKIEIKLRDKFSKKVKKLRDKEMKSRLRFDKIEIKLRDKFSKKERRLIEREHFPRVLFPDNWFSIKTFLFAFIVVYGICLLLLSIFYLRILSG